MTAGLRPTARIAWRAVPEGAVRREVAWELLRELLPPGAVITNCCPRCGGDHGPVEITGAGVVAGVAYAGSLAVVAVADASRVSAVGIDAEPEVDARRAAAGMRGLLGPGEATVRDWTRVEASLKADGRGLRVDPASVAVTPAGSDWTAEVPGGGSFIGWDAAGPEGIVVSVAVRAAVSVAVRAAPEGQSGRSTT